MVLRSGYLALALKLQESAEKHPETFKVKLEAALAAETEDGPWKQFLEAGARHSASDMGHLQAIHDASTVLGAACGGGMVEAAKPVEEGLRLQESATAAEVIQVAEARGDYEIKLITPGRGAMAVYPAEVLKRDGPAAFPQHTKVYMNHPTKMEAGEPMGNRDVKRLAAVLTQPAAWKESHAKGPGLYSRIKVFSDHAQEVEEKSPYLGMSVILNGAQKMEAGRKVFEDGLPVLSKITSGESVDFVPVAGAGGLILQESAKAAIPTQEAAMTAEDVQKLVEAAVRTARLPEDARREATRLLETVAIKPKTRDIIIEGVLRGTLPVKEGGLDTEEFGKLVVAEAQRIVSAIEAERPGMGQVSGFGLPGVGPQLVPEKPEIIAAREAKGKAEEEDLIKTFESLGMTRTGAEIAAKGRVA